jgi:hypothetical protein
MIHIDDVIDAFASAVNRLRDRIGTPTSAIEVYNVGTGTSTPAIELIQKVMALTNSSSPVQTIPGDDRFPDRYIGSTTKAQEVLGFSAKIGQDQGLHRLAMSFIANTIDYLEDKVNAECSTPTTYSSADLAALDGCTGTISVNGPEQIEYLQKAEGEGSKFEWVDSDEPQTWQFSVSHKSRDVRIRFFQIGQEGQDTYFEATEPGHLLGSRTEFAAKVDSQTGFVALSFPSSQADMVPEHLLTSKNKIQYRLTPFCCPGKPTPWPFYVEDPLASAINDQRRETVRQFNASQPTIACDRLRTAVDVAKARLDRLDALTNPSKLDKAPLPTGTAGEWRLRSLDPCRNLCDHPTVCLDTGNCACVQSSCIFDQRFPFAAFANRPSLSYPPPSVNWDDLSAHDPDVLIKQVAEFSWLNVLRPPARRYLGRNPVFPPVHLTRLPDEVQTHRDANSIDFDKVQSTWHGCFSADAAMERGFRLLSREYTPESLVFMPYYAGTLMVSYELWRC